MSDTGKPPVYVIPEEHRKKLEDLLGEILADQREEWLKGKVFDLYKQDSGHDMPEENCKKIEDLLNELPPELRESQLKTMIFALWKRFRDRGVSPPD